MVKVLLAGASGAIGIPLVRQLRAAGHEVLAVHHSPAHRDRLSIAGAEPLLVDVLDRKDLVTAVGGHRCAAVIASLSAVERIPARHKDVAAINRLRIEGIANLLATAEHVGAHKFLTQSTVLGYGVGDSDDRVLTEADEFCPRGYRRAVDPLAALRSSEQRVLGASHLEGIALRYGHFYGPGPAGNRMVEALRRRKLPVFRPSRAQPWIYVDDAAAATVAALENGAPGEAYNVADNEAVSFAEMMTGMAVALGAPPPRELPSWLLGAAPHAKAAMTRALHVGNAKARRELAWTPSFPTWRHGIPELAEHYHSRAAAEFAPSR